MSTWEIRIAGIVQGVGFRPAVYALAQQARIRGAVSNGVEGVKIHFEGDEITARTFYQKILDNAPEIAHILHSSLNPIAPQFFDNFRIIESENSSKCSLWMTPDLGLCNTCKQELHDPANRRFDYPFITCTQCGPRFSILKDIPFDRPTTTMEKFAMCEACLGEYQDPQNTRHYAQTNSCPTCGVTLTLYGKDPLCKVTGNNPHIRQEVLKYWKKGAIVAIKGIGGYLLTCDATNQEGVQTLRDRKQRPSKPFAIMVGDTEGFALSDPEYAWFNSPQAPLVLVPKPKGLNLAPGLAAGLSTVGIMRPYAPLFEWLQTPFGKPLVATSANIHTSPIIYRDEEAEKLLAIADYVLTHNRDIVLPQDDSVLQVAPLSQKPILLRRSRGWAPSYLPKLPQDSTEPLWAAGADLKATMGFLHEGKVYLSPYLGDLSHADTEERYLFTRAYLQGILRAHPQVLLHDLHPNYVSTRLAKIWGTDQGIPIQGIQHHKAHFAAILGEHRLFRNQDPILGFIWDGTGYGDDGNIWGGECFVFSQGSITRVGHIAHFPAIAGDKMAREPRLCALAMLPQEQACQEKFSAGELRIYRTVLKRPKVLSSSMGRVFDAVASLLGVADIQYYEGEAALKLETLAREYLNNHGYLPLPYSLGTCFPEFPVEPLLMQLLNEKQMGMDLELCAARFHATLINYIQSVAEHLGIHRIALSGGVFQNAVLVDGLFQQLSGRFTLYVHEALSPNDENIAFGQLMMYTEKIDG